MTSFFNRTQRLLLAGVVLVLLLLAAGVAGLRYWFLPNIDDHRERIAQAASSALGQPVEIGAIFAGWRGPRVQLVLNDVTIRDAAGQRALMLGKVDTAVAWLPLMTGEVRLSSLTLDAPELRIERRQNGDIRVAGIEVQREDEGGDFAGWLFSQHAITVNDAKIEWRDEQRNAPPILFTGVDLKLENDGANHRFGLHATPPPGIASPLDVRGDVNGSTAADILRWRGQLYAGLDSVDLAALRPWLELPIDVTQGTGTIRAWLEFDNQRFSSATADLALSNVKTRIAADLPETELGQVNGRVSWTGSDGGFEVHTERLALGAAGDQPVDFALAVVEARGEQPAHGELKVSELKIAPLLTLADSLPLQQPLPHDLRGAVPGGTLKNVALKWRGPWQAPVAYQGKMDFSQVSFAPHGNFPGAKNLSGSVELNEHAGSLKLDSRESSFEMPLVFEQRLLFDSVSADVAWKRGAGQWEFDLKRVALANSHFEGAASGTYRMIPGERGYADISGAFTRTDAAAVWRYVPLKIGANTREWLKSALVAGHSDNMKFRVKGDLENFPFGKSEDEIFELTAKAKNGVLKYADDWPPIENVHADVRFHGRSLDVRASNATMSGARIVSVHAAIPDLVIKDELLQVTGEAEGATSRFLAFIEKSPVHDMIDRFTDGLTAEGDGKLGIEITLPLRHRDDTRIEGAYTFNDNRLMVPDLPPLSAINGTLKFTEASAELEPTSAVVLGGPINFNANAKEGAGIVIAANGSADVENLRKIQDHPWLAHVRGSAAWRGSLELRDKLANFTIESDLRGVTSELPAPLGKNAAEARELKIVRTMPASKRDQIAISLGNIASLRAARNWERGKAEIERAALNFGAPAALPEQRMVTINGSLPALHLDEWKKLSSTGGAPELPGAAQIDLRVASLITGERQFNALHVVARKQADDWTATVKGQELNGALTWKPGGRGNLTARFSELTLPDAPENAASAKLVASEMPAIDVIAENFSTHGKRFGRLELLGTPDGANWRIEKLNMTNPDGALSSSGSWQADPSRTSLKVNLNVGNVGSYLAHYDYPEGIKGGSAEIEGDISWPGSPMEFEYSRLDGDLILVARKGRFVQLKPGLGKLLGLVSLQALPRRIQLDFKDIFSEGLEFDHIAGELKITDGVMVTDDFTIRGTAGRILMKGDVDLDDETQKLAVKVTPTLGDSVAIAAAIANPIAGVATYIASKVLKDPLDNFLSYEYSVRGSWEEPVVTKVSKAPEAPQPFGAQ